MSGNDHERLSEVFARAAEMPPEQRRRFLDRIGSGNPRLRADVESLVNCQEDLPPILNTGEPLTGLPPINRRSPEGIGPFRIVNLIGEGGMGVVYEAEQRKPIRRRVALKLIRFGFESEQVVSRFEMERKVLARLDHPGIARVLDAGTTDNNLPYFAMELVRGTPITEYCDRSRLGVRERLGLFLRVCEAVEHAHRNAVMHRDIKPSNILVADIDGRPVPKIIDFGVAKALGDASESRALLTRTGQLIGTPAYMSPEQTSNAQDLDTRTDVYSLGAVLYELLVGRRPFDLTDQDTPDSDELRRRIREDDPPVPSERLAALGPACESVARDRGTVPVALRRRVRGDLDWIVMRALEKDRSRRYGSATELAEDIQRHLDHEPVRATPPSVAYRLRKFACRHRAGVALATVLVPVLLGFVVAQVVQTKRIARERDLSEQVSEFLIEFYATQPLLVGRYGGVPLGEIIERGVEKAEHELADRPELQARLLLALGQTLLSAKDLARAEPTLDEAWIRLRELHGADDPLTLEAATSLAKLHTYRRRYDDAETLLLASLESGRRTLGEHHADTARVRAELGYLYKLMKDYDRSAGFYETALDDMRRSLGDDHRETVLAACLLASVYLEQRRLDEAEALLLEAIPRLEEQDPEKGMAHYNLASIAALGGQRDRALSLLRQAVYEYHFIIGFQSDRNFAPLVDDPEFIELGKRTRILNPDVAYYYRDRARILAAQGRFDEAELIYLGFLRDRPWGGELEPWYLGRLYAAQGRYEEAEELIAEHLEARSASLGPGHPDLVFALWHLALCRTGQGDRDGAITYLEQAIGILERSREITDGSLEYARALLDAAQGDRDGALQHLSVVVERGFWDPAWHERDLLLEPLLGTPEYEAIVATTERRFAYP